jgi:multicomponent Na+:H+ antiporter subunit C
MLSATLVFAFTGIALFALGLRGALSHRELLGRVLGINVSGAGVFLMLVSLAYRGPLAAPDPLPHALVLTGIVVAVSATALALALGRQLRRAQAAESGGRSDG